MKIWNDYLTEERELTEGMFFHAKVSEYRPVVKEMVQNIFKALKADKTVEPFTLSKNLGLSGTSISGSHDSDFSSMFNFYFKDRRDASGRVLLTYLIGESDDGKNDAIVNGKVNVTISIFCPAETVEEFTAFVKSIVKAAKVPSGCHTETPKIKVVKGYGMDDPKVIHCEYVIDVPEKLRGLKEKA